MDKFWALLAICEENLPVADESPTPTQGPATQSFDVFFCMGLNI